MSLVAPDQDPYGLLTPSGVREVVQGHTEPRLWTPPLRPLTPETSYGFDVCEFAERHDRPLDPWQRWLVVHAGELLPDGRPRFRRVLVLVARQNGKTEVLVVLTLYWLFRDHQPVIFGSSTTVDYAREPWQKVRELAEDDPALWARVPRKGGIRETNGEQTITVEHPCPACEGTGREPIPDGTDSSEAPTCAACFGRRISGRSRYKIGASNRRGGRSLAINRGIADELREQDNYQAYGAMIHAMNAVPTAQAFLISNQGDDRAVVLNDLRDAALGFINDGTGDPRLGLFEWSSPEGSDPEDVPALQAANPNLGVRINLDDLLGEARTAKRAGGEALTTFKIEAMCMRVPKLDPAIDPAKWRAGRDEVALDDLRDRLACCLEVSMDGQHATLCVAAAEPATKLVRVEVAQVWDGPGCTAALRRDLAPWLTRIRPKVFGWFPNGPAAAIAADLADRSKRPGRRPWPPAGIRVEEIRTEVPAVCMGFADLVDSGELRHPDDDLLNAHVASTERVWVGPRWVFGNQLDQHIDGSWSAAGAVHLARALPVPSGKPRLIVAP